MAIEFSQLMLRLGTSKDKTITLYTFTYWEALYTEILEIDSDACALFKDIFMDLLRLIRVQCIVPKDVDIEDLLTTDNRDDIIKLRANLCT